MSNRITTVQGHNLESLRAIPDNTFQCIVTSPPYYGLRSYLKDGHPLKRFEIGCEKTPEEYVAKLVGIFRESRRALREDGVLFLNLGDSYARTQESNVPQTKNPDCIPPISKQGSSDGAVGRADRPGTRAAASGIKPKDLIGIPWMVAFALRADGWYLRAENIWAKGISCCDEYSGSCMPESVTDRTTKGHETVFMLTKSANYFYDYEGVKEKNSDNMIQVETNGRNLRSVWAINPEPCKLAHFAVMPTRLARLCLMAGTSPKGCCADCGSPWERVLEIIPSTSKECPKTQAAHEARGGIGEPCGTLGKSGSGRIEGYTKTTGWQPTCECHGIIVKETVILPARISKADAALWGADSNGEYNGKSTKNHTTVGVQDASALKARIIANATEDREVTRNIYRSDIPLDKHPMKRCRALDPFGGSGTLGQVAMELGIDCTLLELNPEYIQMIEQRTNVTPGFNLT